MPQRTPPEIIPPPSSISTASWEGEEEEISGKKLSYTSTQSFNILDDDNLRSACDACTSSKTRCTGGNPCVRCRKRSVKCIFSEKRRCGPKRKENSVDPYSAQSKNLHGYSNAPLSSIEESTFLNATEKNWLLVFLSGLNTFLPVVNEEYILKTLHHVSSFTSDIERERHHACRAILWGSISLGALISNSEPEAEHFNLVARSELKDCFDAAVPELAIAFLVLTEYYLYRFDNTKLIRYAGLARQSLCEMSVIPNILAETVRLLQVTLYLTRAGEAPDVSIPSPRSTRRLSPLCAKERCLHIISFLLMSIYTALRPDESHLSGAIPLVDDSHLLLLASEIPELLVCYERDDNMSKLVGNVLYGYLLLRTGHTPEAINASETVARVVEEQPSILKFPMTWVMSCCALEGLQRFGRLTVSGKLLSIMTPISAKLKFSNKCCVVGAEMLAMYSGSGDSVTLSADEVIEENKRRQIQQAQYFQQMQIMQFQKLFQQQQYGNLHQPPIQRPLQINTILTSDVPVHTTVPQYTFINELFHATQKVIPEADEFSIAPNLSRKI